MLATRTLKVAGSAFVMGLWAALCLPGLAAAESISAPCCSDLESRITDLEAFSARKGNRKVSLVVSGIVTWPIMVWDDGKQTDAFVVSNEVKRPRVRVAGTAPIDSATSAGFVIEIGPNPSPFAPMDQTRYVSSGGPLEVRYAHWQLKNKALGDVSLGLVSMATDGATESTLANTTSVMSPGLPILLGYLERGWYIRRDDGTLSDMRFGDVIFKGRNAVWGEGHRWAAARYDSPAIAGFTLSASWGQNDFKDIALRFAGETGRVRVAAALGAAQWEDDSPQNRRGCARTTDRMRLDCWEIGGSIAVMDTATGLFLNAAAGYGQDNNTAHLYGDISGIDDDEAFYYLVGGIERQWLACGKTTIFGQYWHKDAGAGVLYTGQRIDAATLGAQDFISGADVTIYGASVVQTLAEGVDLYASVNRVESTLRTSATGAAEGSVTSEIRPFDFLLTGMSVRF